MNIFTEIQGFKGDLKPIHRLQVKIFCYKHTFFLQFLLVSGVEHSVSAIHIYLHIFSYLFHYGLMNIVPCTIQ